MLIKFVAVGQSMFPLIKSGQIVYADTETKYDIQNDDIIVFKKVSLRCHRVVKKFKYNGEIFFLTKGDNNLENDQFIVSVKEVIGRVVLDGVFSGEYVEE